MKEKTFMAVIDGELVVLVNPSFGEPHCPQWSAFFNGKWYLMVPEVKMQELLEKYNSFLKYQKYSLIFSLDFPEINAIM